MSILWKYLDKRNGTIQAIKDFDAMKFIIDTTDERIKSEASQMTSVRSPGMDGMPHAHDPHAGEERIVKGIEEIDILKERYRQAVEYMDWYVPAWNQLSEDEKYILDEFYGGDSEGAVVRVADYFGIERSSAYNRKNRALDHLTTLLFGKE